jgi:hypothetical protein
MTNGDSVARARERLVARARQDRFFLGWALAEYKAAHGLDERQLAARLECRLDALGRLSLCRLPDDLGDRFQEDIASIAGFVSCNPDGLIQLVREVAALDALRREGAGSSALLMAARDKKPDPENGSAKAEKK